jgi:hypothetical protein
MTTITYVVVDQNVKRSAFDTEAEAITFARQTAADGQAAYVLEVTSRFVTGFSAWEVVHA